MKLRCPPREDNTLSCGRCLRLKVSCLTPPPKESGKPAFHLISNLNGPRESPQPGQHLHRRSSESTELEKWSWQGSAEYQSRSQGNVSDVSQSLLHPSFQSPLPSTFGISERFTPPITCQRQEAIFADFEFSDFMYSEVLPIGMETPASIISSSPFDTKNFSPSEPMPKASSFVVETDPNLTGLRLSLSQRCHHSRLAATSNSSGGSLSESLDKDMDKSNALGKLWFGDALRDISTFLSIIESHNQGKNTATTNQNGSTQNSTISIVIVLDMLLAYLQIVTVFDELCAQLYDHLRTSSQGSLSELQTLPGLQLAGLSVEHGQLQMKILLQAVVHHFEMIEKSLGLSITYRVSGRLDEYTGLLKNDKQYDDLIAIVMEDDSGKMSLNSLKQNLKNMAQIIYM